MKVLGITGGVGAGKSTVLMYLKEHYGARVIQADQVGHLLQQPHESCYRRIVELFGTTVLNADGTTTVRSLARSFMQIRRKWRG